MLTVVQKSVARSSCDHYSHTCDGCQVSFDHDTGETMTVTFAAWLESQLARREWSPTEFARRLDMRHSAVSMWLSGQRVPTPKSIDRIADTLNLDVDTVLTIAGHRPPDYTVDPDSPEAELLPLIRKIDWDADPMRLRGIKVQLEGYLQVDRMRRGEGE